MVVFQVVGIWVAIAVLALGITPPLTKLVKGRWFDSEELTSVFAVFFIWPVIICVMPLVSLYEFGRRLVCRGLGSGDRNC